MENIKVVNLIIWDGSVESFNKIVDLLFPREDVQIVFLDENGEWTNKFTNRFMTMFIPWKKSSKYNQQYDMTFRVGDTFFYDKKDKK